MDEYPFSSYRGYLEEEGQEWVDIYFDKYPIIDFTIEEDAF